MLKPGTLVRRLILRRNVLIPIQRPLVVNSLYKLAEGKSKMTSGLLAGQTNSIITMALQIHSVILISENIDLTIS
jgi:hypothetical protein